MSGFKNIFQKMTEIHLTILSIHNSYIANQK